MEDKEAIEKNGEDDEVKETLCPKWVCFGAESSLPLLRTMIMMIRRKSSQRQLQALPMIVGQLVVRGSRRAPTPPPDGPTGSAESARPRGSFLSLLFRGAAPLAALVTSFRS